MKKQAIKPARYFSNQMLADARQRGDQLADVCIQSVFEQVGMTGLRTFFQWLVKKILIGKVS
jgi:RNase P/RNase MRP subunit POP5